MIAAESIMAAIVPPETRVGLMVLQVVVLSGLLWGCVADVISPSLGLKCDRVNFRASIYLAQLTKLRLFQKTDHFFPDSKRLD